TRFDNVKSVPVTPAELETPVKLNDDAARPGAAADETYVFKMSRSRYSQNKVPFIYLSENESLADVAKSYDLFVRELLRFNDVDSPDDLGPGSVVYLQHKKSKSAKMVDKYVAEGGETLWEVSQRFGVRLKNLMKRNNLPADYVLKSEETVRLR
ncbi:MAG: LysM peptidoglycan-binding domain-containing protein, partial [Candidatus Cryptobacteroides sp.]